MMDLLAKLKGILIPPHIAIKTAIVVLMAYALTWILIKPFTFSLSSVSTKAATDFKITDLYHSVADGRPVRHVSQDIVIVDINNYNRQEIAQSIEQINAYGPKAIGLDVIFPEQREGDEPLLEAIANAKNVVMGVSLATDDSTGQLKVDQSSWFVPDIKGLKLGAVNYPITGEEGVIREFPLYFTLQQNDTIDSFSTSLCKIAKPEEAAILLKRGHDAEVINFPSKEFPIVDALMVDENPEIFKDKIVLMGALNDNSDEHATPIDSRMPGVMLHARSLQTAIDGDYLNNCPGWIQKFIALILTSLFVFLNLYTDPKVKGLFLRMAQFAALITVIFGGYWFFIEKHFVIDFSQSFLMLSFAFFSCDIWIGLTNLPDWLRQKRLRLRKRLTQYKT